MGFGCRRVLFTCPTVGGKTVIAAEVIRLAVARGSRVLFLAHRRELIDQTADKLTRFEVPHGILLAGRPEVLHRPVQVASVQTLIRRPGRLSHVDLVFIDEAHHVTEENTYNKLLGWYPNAKTIGLTATPWRMDGKGLADIFDGHVMATTPRELRDMGYLVTVGGWEYDALNTKGVRIRMGDFMARELEDRAMSTTLFGNIIAEWKQHAGNVRTVLFACTVKHSKAMADAFQNAGIAAEHVDAETPDTQRAAILDRLRIGETKIVTNVNVITEGFDLPELECVILARPTLSTSLYLQMVGRVLRPAPGKAAARIHDHARCLASHGHPYALRDFSPSRTALSPRLAADGGSSASPTLHCPDCSSVTSAWPCDACGGLPTREKQIEIEMAARRVAISEDGTAPRRRKSGVEELRLQFEQLEEFERKRAFFKFVRKHGPRKALGVYRWWSGETAWPPRAWSEEARFLNNPDVDVSPAEDA